MLCGNKQEIEKILPYVADRLQKALRYIAVTNFAEVANGEYEIDGRDVFVRVNTYSTEPKECKQPEAHNEYIDVQYLGAGQEVIYFAPRTEEHVVTEDHAEASDLLFLSSSMKRTALFYTPVILPCFFRGNCTDLAVMLAARQGRCRK